MKEPFKNVTAFMQGNFNDLHFILSKVNKLREIENKISPLLENKHVKKVKVANLEGSTLTLLAANASIATEIRYQSDTLLAKCKADAALQHIKSIKCIISPHQLKYENKNAPIEQKLVLSDKAAKAINEIAQGIHDQEVRNALSRIADHTEE